MLPCNGCTYRRSIPGDCHIKCAFSWVKAVDVEGMRLPIPPPGSVSVEPIMKWFAFPMNYDPVWGPDTCTARAEAVDKEMVADESEIALATFSIREFLGAILGD